MSNWRYPKGPFHYLDDIQEFWLQTGAMRCDAQNEPTTRDSAADGLVTMRRSYETDQALPQVLGGLPMARSGRIIPTDASEREGGLP